MGTKSSIYYGEDESGIALHIYWELAEREVVHGKMVAAPLFMGINHPYEIDQNPIHLPPDVAQRICEALGQVPDFKII